MNSIDEFPWLAIPGVAAMLSLFLYTMNTSDFWTVLFPTYLCEALFFIGLGLQSPAVKKQFGLKNKSLKDIDLLTSLMALMWLINQVVGHWYALLPKPIVSWATAFVSLVAFLELIGYPVIDITDYTDPIEEVLGIFKYQVDMALILIFAVWKVYLNVYTGSKAWTEPIVLWGVAIALMTGGWLADVFLFGDTDYGEIGLGDYALIIGALLCVYTAFTIQGAGLTLLQI